MAARLRVCQWPLSDPRTWHMSEATIPPLLAVLTHDEGLQIAVLILRLLRSTVADA